MALPHFFLFWSPAELVQELVTGRTKPQRAPVQNRRPAPFGHAPLAAIIEETIASRTPPPRSKRRRPQLTSAVCIPISTDSTRQNGDRETIQTAPTLQTDGEIAPGQRSGQHWGQLWQWIDTAQMTPAHTRRRQVSLLTKHITGAGLCRRRHCSVLTADISQHDTIYSPTERRRG